MSDRISRITLETKTSYPVGVSIQVSLNGDCDPRADFCDSLNQYAVHASDGNGKNFHLWLPPAGARELLDVLSQALGEQEAESDAA